MALELLLDGSKGGFPVFSWLLPVFGGVFMGCGLLCISERIRVRGFCWIGGALVNVKWV